MGGRAAEGGFVGRARELERLAAAARQAVAGRGSTVVLVGDAGIGKTRLAEEAAARCAALGAEVLWTACREEGGAPAFFPWRDLLAARAGHVDDATMAADVGEWADVLTPLLLPAGPSRAAAPRDTGGAVDAGFDPEASRFRLFEAVTAVLLRAAARRPLVLVLDDLHWADVPSLLLLRFFTRDLRRGRVLVIGTYRDADVDWESERGRLLAELGSPGATLRLQDLDADEVAELVAGVAGRSPAPETTAAIRDHAGGNPLFVLELAALPPAQWRPAAGTARSEASIPQRLQVMLEGRLARLGRPCRQVLDVAAVVGAEFRLDLVGTVLGWSHDDVPAAVDEATGARVVAPVPARLGTWRFRHGLVRDVVYELLGREARAALHLRVGEALEAAPDRDAHLGELARHFLAVSSPTDTARAVNYCEEAGRQALGSLAYEEAAELFARALEVLGTGRAGDARRVELLLLLGDARMRAGDLAGSRTAFEAAADDARRRGRPEELARAALGFGAGLGGFEVRLFDDVQLELLEEALAALGPDDSSLRAWVLARLSVALSFVAPGDRRRALSEEAVAVARRVGDDAALAHALASRCDAIAGPAHAEQRRADASEIVRLARAAGDEALELLGLRLRVVAGLELADMAAVDADIGAFARTAAAVRQPLYQWYVPLWRAMRAAMEGRLRDAERHNDAAAEIGARAQSQNAFLTAHGQRFVFQCERGELEDAERRLRAMVDQDLPLGYSVRAWMTAVVAGQGRRAEASALLDRLVAGDLGELPEQDAEWLPAVCQLAEACAAVGAGEAAEAVYRRLLPFRDRFAVDGIGDACLGSVERHLGLLAAAAGRHDDAGAHFDAALSANRAAGSPLLSAHVLRAWGGPRLPEALAAYRELGLDRWVAETRRRLDALTGGPSGPAEPAADDGNVFRRDGTTWRIGFAGRVVHLPDAKGLHDVARLLARPGVEQHALDLVGGKLVESGTGAALDRRARHEYKARLAQLDADLDQAAAHHDRPRADALAEERDFLVRELAAAFGLGGRPRRGSDAAERARTAVAWRIRDSLRKIEAAHPALGRHLRNSIRTGLYCSYEPEQPVDWHL